MKCPYCLENFHENWFYVIFPPKEKSHSHSEYIEEMEYSFSIKYCYCPVCKKVIIYLGRILSNELGGLKSITIPSLTTDTIYTCFEWNLLKPKNISRTPLSKEIPKEFADDYSEACLVLSDSPKASAALSRRCLQNLLLEKAGAKGSNFSQQIQYVLDSKNLPSNLAEGLDAVRNIGNFAAHAIKSKSSGEIVKVDPGEAEWNLDILEELFDFYFVRPSIYAKKKDALNKKLKDSGKPPLKEV